MQTNVGPNFDWIKARSVCSLAQVFKELEMGVRSDVEKMNVLSNPQRTFKFSVHDMTFAAMEVTGIIEIESVDFAITKSGLINISTDDTLILSAAVTLDNQGQCKLKIQSTGEELDQWQVRKMALENLFFGPTKILPA